MIMNIRRELNQLRDFERERGFQHQIEDNQYYTDLRIARIVRYTHSIEKGLSINKPRLGFGYEKIMTLFSLMDEYINSDSNEYSCIYMALDAISEYCQYHDINNYKTDKIDEIKQKYESVCSLLKYESMSSKKYGGTQVIYKRDLVFDFPQIEKLFYTRHSVREYLPGEVNMEQIEKAVSMAQMAPSACNRQAVRVYVIDSKKYVEDMDVSLEGIGGFTDDVDKFLLITGQVSAYEEYEYKQFIVSAGIFAGYLTLALHACNIGACVIQRSVRPDKKWLAFCEKNGIPKDEQIVCMVAVGNLKDEMKVPVSKRYNLDRVLKVL